jgi:hypothetical protein
VVANKWSVVLLLTLSLTAFQNCSSQKTIENKGYVLTDVFSASSFNLVGNVDHSFFDAGEGVEASDSSIKYQFNFLDNTVTKLIAPNSSPSNYSAVKICNYAEDSSVGDIGKILSSAQVCVYKANTRADSTFCPMESSGDGEIASFALINQLNGRHHFVGLDANRLLSELDPSCDPEVTKLCDEEKEVVILPIARLVLNQFDFESDCVEF